MTARPRPLRLFVAAYPPSEVVEALQAARRGLFDGGLRIVPAGQIHLTLHFIGPIDPNDLDRTIESVELACNGIAPFELQPLRLATLPPRGHPRVLVAETTCPPALTELHRRLAHRLTRQPRRDPADRFLPHLTLARHPPGRPSQRANESVEMTPFAIRTIALMRSVLHPEGAEHRQLAGVELLP